MTEPESDLADDGLGFLVLPCSLFAADDFLEEVPPLGDFEDDAAEPLRDGDGDSSNSFLDT